MDAQILARNVARVQHRDLGERRNLLLRGHLAPSTLMACLMLEVVTLAAIGRGQSPLEQTGVKGSIH
jgi:hypothetical protein